MFAKLAFALVLVAAPVLAQESTEQAEVMALSADDAKECVEVVCKRITKAAYELIAQRLAKAERIEAIANRLAAELAKKPNPKFCL